MISLEIRIITHPQREKQADALADILEATSDASVSLYIDEEGLGAKANHLAALRDPSEASHVLILEDDAQPCQGWYDYCIEWLDKHPTSLVSFYLGSGRPVFAQAKVDELLKGISLSRHSSIKLPRLIHGVAYAFPSSAVEGFKEAQSSSPEADRAVGQLWQSLNIGPILYPVFSAFDHRDDTPLIQRDRTPIPRKARYLIGETIGE